MVGPIRVDGLASGIDYGSIVEQLLSAQRRPITQFQDRITIAAKKKAGLLQLNANLLAYKSSMGALSKPSFWNRTQVASSNENALEASGSQVASTGAYTFSVRRLATAHQNISNGFIDADTTQLTSTDSVITLEIPDEATMAFHCD